LWELASGAAIAKAIAMRICSLLIFLTACTAYASNQPDPSNQPVRLTCTNSVAHYCATNSCNRTLAAAKQDKILCPATLTRCGRYEVVGHSSVDVLTRWYYQAGQLVAITSRIFPGHYVCLAGPTTFVAPPCAGPAHTLPACGP
jgi:hypothetical protein